MWLISTTPNFLIALHRRLQATAAELRALQDRLPHRLIPMVETYGDGGDVEHPASPGWTGDKREQVDALWKRRAELAASVIAHPFFSALSGDSVMKARAALKHLDDAPQNGDG
ncbi:hypothetical protein ACWGCW_14190 [Streptomyces sp. NPDC054933]